MYSHGTTSKRVRFVPMTMMYSYKEQFPCKVIVRRESNDWLTYSYNLTSLTRFFHTSYVVAILALRIRGKQLIKHLSKSRSICNDVRVIRLVETGCSLQWTLQFLTSPYNALPAAESSRSVGGRSPTSILPDFVEVGFYIQSSSRTDPAKDRASFSVFDRAGEKKKLIPQIKPQASRTAQGSSTSPCFLRMSFSNTNQKSTGGIRDESRN